MKNKIYTQIKNNNKISFNELFYSNKDNLKDKAELATLIKILESDNLILNYANNFYDLTQFEDVSGFVHWNINGFCWLSNTNDDINEFGLSFDLNDDLDSIYNKRSAHYGHSVNAKRVIIDDREFIYIINSKPTKNVKLLATYQKNKNEWVILNSGFSFSFRNNLGNIENGTLAIFDSKEHSVIEYLGNIKDNGIESRIVEILGDIKSAPLLEEENYQEEQSNGLSNSQNFINKPFYTIDSAYTQDLDDAIWIEKDGENYNLWVAIADVTSFVKENTVLDEHAKNVCTSIYLKHKTIHMLDKKLAQHYCALNLAGDKLAVVCQLTFDKDLNLINQEFTHSKVKVKYQLTYNDVNKMLEGKDPSESHYFDESQKSVLPISTSSYNADINLVNSLHTLNEFKDKFELKTVQTEYNRDDFWLLDRYEMSLNEHGKIKELYMRTDSTNSEKMVEKAMLAANIAAANFIGQRYPQFGLFRNQLKPLEGEGPKPAFYQELNQGHWGLNTHTYTHFTSPIRRYCDLLVHRLIKDALSNQKTTSVNLEEIAKQINLQHYKTKQFDNKLKNLLLPQYIQQLLNDKTFDNHFKVIDITHNGMVFKNLQHIELFVPTFKLDRELGDRLQFISSNNDLNTICCSDKKDIINELNQNIKIIIYVDDFNWTDDRKNLFIKTHLKNKPSTLKL